MTRADFRPGAEHLHRHREWRRIVTGAVREENEMAELKIVQNLSFSTTQCYLCGVEFAMPAEMLRARRNDHKEFHCPNGHGQVFTGKTEAQKLQEQLAAEQTRRATAETEAVYQRTLAESATKNLARLQKRVKHGVCPCCKRTVKQLAQHMATKHPEFKTDGES